ncbi:MAG: hypothetical protein JWM59_881 [Verrucomicrobiales bacterium]|nr:hypothetical protein [Verrucomicrobiales bacterium]
MPPKAVDPRARDSLFRHKSSLKWFDVIVTNRISVKAGMQLNQGLDTDLEHGGSLPVLALLWDELAGSHNYGSFRQEFRSELEHLDRFQNDYPEIPARVLTGILEARVIDAFRERFPREAILALRARLNCSN